MSSISQNRPQKSEFTLGKAYLVWLTWLLLSVAALVALAFVTPLMSQMTSALSYFKADMTGTIAPLAVGSYLVLSFFTFWFPILASGSKIRAGILVGCLVAITAITAVVILTAFGNLPGLLGTGAALASVPLYIAFPYLTVVAIYVIAQLIFWPRNKKKA